MISHTTLTKSNVMIFWLYKGNGYLGHCINEDLDDDDDDDISRQYKQIYAQDNALIRKCFMCTVY